VSRNLARPPASAGDRAHDRSVYPFERFSDEAKRTLALAQEEAESSRRSYIGTGHLLLGLLRVVESLGATVLADLGVEEATARAAVDAAERRPAGPDVVGRGLPTSRVRRVIELAFQEARRLGDTAVTTGFVLVGLLLEVDGVASQVLRDAGVSVDLVRQALAQLAEAGIGETVSGTVHVSGPARSAECQRILDAAAREASAMSIPAEPDHLLRALLSQDGFTARVLARLAVDRAEVLRAATPPADVQALWDTVQQVRTERERVAAAGDRELAASVRARELELRRELIERLRQWRESP
jgi:ATP-dependent Clp protease ATP-binding subunit ClpA